jgi:hypothetical protein
MTFEGTQFVVEFRGEPLTDETRERLQARIEAAVVDELSAIASERGEVAAPAEMGDWMKAFERINRPPTFGIMMPHPRTHPWIR